MAATKQRSKKSGLECCARRGRQNDYDCRVFPAAVQDTKDGWLKKRITSTTDVYVGGKG